MKNWMVSKSDRGEISVFDGRDDFVACFKDGKWFGELIFQACEEEEFTILESDEEALRILEEARKVLGRTFKEESTTK